MCYDILCVIVSTKVTFNKLFTLRKCNINENNKRSNAFENRKKKLNKVTDKEISNDLNFI